MTQINITTNDGKKFVVDANIALISPTIKNLIDDGMIQDADNPIPLLNIDSLTLKRIIDYLERHIDEKNKTDDDKKKIEEVDKKFSTELSVNDKFKVIFGANYLDIKPLVNLMAKAINALLLDKSDEEIGKTFGVDISKFTPEEEEKVKAENQWAIQEGVDDPRTEEEKAKMMQNAQANANSNATADADDAEDE